MTEIFTPLKLAGNAEDCSFTAIYSATEKRQRTGSPRRFAMLKGRPKRRQFLGLLQSSGAFTPAHMNQKFHPIASDL
jgi:hypothetical protein